MAWWWYQGPLQLGDLCFGTVEAILCQLPSTGASSIENLVPTRTPPWYSNPNDGFLLWSDGWCSAARLMHVSCHRPCQPLPSASSGWVNLWWWISQRGQGLNISLLQTLKLLLIWNHFFMSYKITLAQRRAKAVWVSWASAMVAVRWVWLSHGVSQSFPRVTKPWRWAWCSALWPLQHPVSFLLLWGVSQNPPLAKCHIIDCLGDRKKCNYSDF